MSFMKPFIYLDDCYEVENKQGETYYVPVMVSGDLEKTSAEDKAQVLHMYIEGEPDTITLHRNKYVARMSAPGYTDCTDWTMHDTQEEAEQYLKEYYDADETDWDDEDED